MDRVTFLNVEIETLRAESQKFRRSLHAENTLYDYGLVWRAFLDWCQEAKRESLPATAETVLLYLTDMLQRGRKISTASIHACGINYYHRQAKLAAPFDSTIRELLDGAKRLRGEQPLQKRPISVDQLRQIAQKMSGNDPKVHRDRAILMLGFASALRRSSIVALNLADLRFMEQGLVVSIKREKQDQEGKGRTIGIARGSHAETCPVRAVEAWIGKRGEKPGPLFTRVYGPTITLDRLDGNVVGDVVKAAVRSIGLNAADYAGHSLRAGFVTAAFEVGVGEIAIAAQTGHRSLSSLRRYVRTEDLFRMNASGMIGL